MKVPQLVSLLCAGRVCPDAKSLEQFNMTSYVWQNLCESSFLCSHHFLLECHSLPSAWISCSWGEVQSLNTTRETNCRYVLWGKLVVSGSVQDDVTILPTATHCASVCSAVVSAVASLQLCVRERVEGSRQECHWISLGLVKIQTKLYDSFIEMKRLTKKPTALVTSNTMDNSKSKSNSTILPHDDKVIIHLVTI